MCEPFFQRQTERLCDSEAKLNDSHYAMENLSSNNEVIITQNEFYIWVDVLTKKLYINR